jgi:hypothetical protein
MRKDTAAMLLSLEELTLIVRCLRTCIERKALSLEEEVEARDLVDELCLAMGRAKERMGRREKDTVYADGRPE